MEERISSLLISGDPRSYSPEFKSLLKIVHVLLRHGSVIANPNGVILGGHGRLDPNNPRCFVVGKEDPRDRPGRLNSLLCLIGAAPPRRRLIAMQIVMRNEREAILDYSDPALVEDACQLSNLIARKLRVTARPEISSTIPLTKTIGVGIAPS